MKSPKFIFDTTPFEVIVPSGTRSYVFTHAKPVIDTSLIHRPVGQKVDEFSRNLETVVRWLTGGADGMRNPETDIYGIVELRMENFANEIAEMAQHAVTSSEEVENETIRDFRARQKDFRSKAKQAFEHARAIADEKVKRQLRTTYRNLIKQWDVLDQDGKGRYAPSTTEALSAEILMAEIEAAGAQKKEMVDRFMKAVNNSSIIG